MSHHERKITLTGIREPGDLVEAIDAIRGDQPGWGALCAGDIRVASGNGGSTLESTRSLVVRLRRQSDAVSVAHLAWKEPGIGRSGRRIDLHIDITTAVAVITLTRNDEASLLGMLHLLADIGPVSATTTRTTRPHKPQQTFAQPHLAGLMWGFQGVLGAAVVSAVSTENWILFVAGVIVSVVIYLYTKGSAGVLGIRSRAIAYVLGAGLTLLVVVTGVLAASR